VHGDSQLLSALRRRLSVWLEGAQAHGVSGRGMERSLVVEVARRGFSGGGERDDFTSVFRTLRQVLGASERRAE
jgi:hypothetical protein